MKTHFIVIGFVAILLIACRSHNVTVKSGDDFELVNPFERSDLKMNIVKIIPAYPIPGEHVQLDVEIANNRDFPEDNLRILLYEGNKLLDTRVIDVGAMKTLHLQFNFSAANHEGVSYYYGTIKSPNQWRLPGGAGTSIDFELFTANRSEPQTDLAINDIRLINEPGLAPMIEVEAENYGNRSKSTILEIMVNNSEIYQEWVKPLDSNEMVKIRIPFCREKIIDVVSAALNPRFYDNEFDAKNNMYSRDFRTKLDLTIEGLSVNAPRFEESDAKYVTVNFKVRNNGNTKIDEDITTQIGTSLFNDEESQVKLITNAGGLEAGESIYISQLFEDIPDEFYIKVKTDIYNQVFEDDEVNNIATSYYKNPVPNVGRWYSIGPTKVLNNALNATGRLNDIAINPKNNMEIYVSGRSGSGGEPGGTGLWKTIDGGLTWYPVSDALDLLLIHAIAVDPKNPSRVIIGTSCRDSSNCTLWESKDSGTSWKKLVTLATLLYEHSTLLIDPLKNYMYLTTENGIFIGDENNNTWNNNLPVNTNQKEMIYELVMDPVSAGTLYAAVIDTGGPGIFRNQAYGVAGAWLELTGCGSNTFPTLGNDIELHLGISGSKLFASYMIGNTFFLYSTTDIICQGSQEMEWKKVLEKDLGSKMCLFDIHVDPNDHKNLYAYWAGPSNVWVSHDGGENIRRVEGLVPHIDTHGFAFDPINSKIIYVLTDGGIYKSSDTGKDKTWSFIGEGIINSEIYYIATIESDPETIIAGTQDNSTISKLKSSDKWQEIPGAGGDGYDVEINPDNKDEYYTMDQYACSLKKHSNGSVTGIGCGFNPRAGRSFNFMIDPNETDRLIAYYDDTLWTAKNPACPIIGDYNGQTRGSKDVWTILWKAPANAGSITSMAFDMKNDIFYAATANVIYYSENRGLDFDTAVKFPAIGGEVLDLALNPDIPEVIYISKNIIGKNRIHLMRKYYLSDEPHYSSSDITAGLPPGLKANALAVDPVTPYVLYAGTQRGVYRGQSLDGGVNWYWEAYNNGIPAGTHFSDLEIYQSTGLLIASTKGRGIYAIRNYADDIVVEVVPSIHYLEPGNIINYIVKVENKGTKTTDFKVSISGLEDFQTGLSPKSLTIGPGQVGSASLSVKVPICLTHKIGHYVFTVTAQKVSYVQEFGQCKADLVVKLPLRQLMADSFEYNDDLPSAALIPLALNQTPTNITGLTLHSAKDVDYYKIQFSSISTEECIPGGPGYGSLEREFLPKYYPGNISITVTEEFCQPIDVSILSYDKSNPPQIISWGIYESQYSNPIIVECPGEQFQTHEFFIKIWHKEGDQVNYSIEVNFRPWFITLKKPLLKFDGMYHEIPSWIWFDLPPWMHELELEGYLNTYEEKLVRFNEQLVQYKNFESQLMEGRLRKFNADMDISNGKYNQGEELLNQCQEIFEGLNANSAIADVYRSRANLATVKGNYTEAYGFLNRAIGLHSELGNHEAVLEDVRQLLKLNELSGDFTQTSDIVLNAYKWAHENDNQDIQIKSLLLLTDSFLQSRDIEGAMSGIILMEDLAGNTEASEYKFEIENKSDQVRKILGTRSYQQLKTTINKLPGETFEIKSGLLTK